MSDRFKDLKNGTILDHRTGLEWQKAPAKPMAWNETQEYAKNLNLGGYNDWRVPTVEELKTLVDLNQFRPASKFPQTPNDVFWSASTDDDGPDWAWGVYFYDGYVDTYGKPSTRYVRCVRRRA